MKPIQRSLLYLGEYLHENCDQYTVWTTVGDICKRKHLFFSWVLFSPEKLKILLRDASDQVQIGKTENLFIFIDLLLSPHTSSSFSPFPPPHKKNPSFVNLCLAILKKYNQDMFQVLKYQSSRPNKSHKHTTTIWLIMHHIYIKLLRNQTSA